MVQTYECEITIDYNLNRLGPDGRFIDHIAFVLCTDGQCHFRFNGKETVLHKQEGMMLPLPILVDEQRPSTDFRAVCVYVNPEILNLPSIVNNHLKDGLINVFVNPIFPLNVEEMGLLSHDFKEVVWRKQNVDFPLRAKTLYHSLQNLILDFVGIYSRHFIDSAPPTSAYPNNPARYLDVMNRFMILLLEGHYVSHRKIDFYADYLHVTSKYLSSVTRMFTGKGASFWINRFTSNQICVLLQTTSLSLTVIASKLGFSSPSHLNTFFRNQMGISPSEYRNTHVPI